MGGNLIKEITSDITSHHLVEGKIKETKADHKITFKIKSITLYLESN